MNARAEMTENDVQGRIVKLIDVASWQVPGLSLSKAESATTIHATLPALQRSAVWKPHQVERMWDSLLRGFPAGAFLLSAYNEDKYGRLGLPLSRKSFAKVQTSTPPTHHLLDGQQRATAIALGFFDIWEKEHIDKRAGGPVLWIDLASPPAGDDRKFVLRLVTRSQPWGYKRSNPEERLEARQMREAMEAYKRFAPQFSDRKPTEFPLQNVWPWDTVAPIPMAFFIKALRSGEEDVAAALKKELQRLPFWSKSKSNSSQVKNKDSRQAKLLDALDGTDEVLHFRFEQICKALQALVTSDPAYRIPAQILPQEDMDATDEAVTDSPTVLAGPDAMETLFVRVNAGGTPLEGEELNYSLLKSTWKEAPQAIEQLQPDGRQLQTPARMVTLITRLLLASEQTKDSKGNFPEAPPSPDLARFRSLMGKGELKGKMQKFISNGAGSIFHQANQLLILNPEHAKETFRLPPALAANMTQGSTGGDVMFLLLRWLDRMREAKHNPFALSKIAQQKLLGFLTAFSWFSIDSTRSLQRLWQSLQRYDADKLPGFFNRENFELLLPRDPDGSLAFIPVVPPTLLKKVIKERFVPGRNSHKGLDGGGELGKEFWRADVPNYHYANWLVPDNIGAFQRSLQSWLKTLPLRETVSPRGSQKLNINKADDKERYNNALWYAWSWFLDRIWSDRRLVQYAQRHWLFQWFPHFDPSVPDQTEDVNRPWDYDHIYPQNLIANKKNIPSVVKEWHSSIGNLRAWPFELNRADQDAKPDAKLEKIAQIEKVYALNSAKQLREASFIEEKEEWPLWKNTVPEKPRSTYLASPYDQEEHKYRQNLVRAITSRFCSLYTEWYNTLCIGRLMPEVK